MKAWVFLVAKLREAQFAAMPEHPVHPAICDEAADEIERNHARIEELKGHLTWLGWSSEGIERAKAEITRLQAELEECRAEAAALRNECADRFMAGYRSRDAELELLKRHQAVCQCGQFMIEHDGLIDHMAVENEQPCPAVVSDHRVTEEG